MGTSLFLVPSSGPKRSDLTDRVTWRASVLWAVEQGFGAHRDGCSPTAFKTAKTSRVVMATGPDDRLMNTSQKPVTIQGQGQGRKSK